MSYRYYGRRYFRKAFTGPRGSRYKNTYWRKSSSYKVAKKALAVAKKVEGMINVEYKHFDGNYTAATTNAGAIQGLCQIVQGNTTAMRDGDEVKLKSIQLRGTIKPHTSSVSNNFVRVILFRVTSGDGSVPTVAGAADGVLNAADIEALRNRQTGSTTKNRYIIHYDKTFQIGPEGNNPGDALIKYYKRVNLSLEWPSAATQNANKNDFMLLVLDDAITNHPTIDVNWRLMYVDN